MFSDELNHASIIDGCRLARAETFVYDHRDIEHLEWGLRESRGPRQPDRDRRRLLDGRRRRAARARSSSSRRRYDARVMVDEAHATGVLGPGGRGSRRRRRLEGEVDVIVGTLGKALGSYGAYVACDAEMAQYLVNTARSLIFSTGPAPPVGGRRAGGARARRASSPAGSSGSATTRRRCATRWRARASTSPAGETPIVPLIVGDADAPSRVRASAPARASSPRRSGRRPCPRAPRGCAWRRWRPTTRPSSSGRPQQLAARPEAGAQPRAADAGRSVARPSSTRARRCRA